jgi:hypothetical protein
MFFPINNKKFLGAGRGWIKLGDDRLEPVQETVYRDNADSPHPDTLNDWQFSGDVSCRLNALQPGVDEVDQCPVMVNDRNRDWVDCAGCSCVNDGRGLVELICYGARMRDDLSGDLRRRQSFGNCRDRHGLRRRVLNGCADLMKRGGGAGLDVLDHAQRVLEPERAQGILADAGRAMKDGRDVRLQARDCVRQAADALFYCSDGSVC